MLARYAASQRLWVAALRLPDPLLHYLAAHGRPIRYGYVPRGWPITAYQNVYATEPGSVDAVEKACARDRKTSVILRGHHVTVGSDEIRQDRRDESLKRKSTQNVGTGRAEVGVCLRRTGVSHLSPMHLSEQ